jgi:hypothetical protein
MARLLLRLGRSLASATRTPNGRGATQAMLGMKKLDIRAMKAAADVGEAS